MYEYDPFQHCCPTMNKYLDPETTEGEFLRYNREVRTYQFILHKRGKKSGVYVAVLYCPWCGSKLPKELNEEWGNALKKEYGLTTNDFQNQDGKWDESKIPEEFRTDEWWKKRGL